jgi:hypothetical protein
MEADAPPVGSGRPDPRSVRDTASQMNHPGHETNLARARSETVTCQRRRAMMDTIAEAIINWDLPYFFGSD